MIVSRAHKLILITGAARSGVPSIAKTIRHCGARGGKIPETPEGDGRGLMENPEIRNTLIVPLLRAIGADPRGQFPLPGIERSRAIAQSLGLAWRWRAGRLLFKVPSGDRRPAFYASNHSCLLWPVWNVAFPEATWVIVRKPNDCLIDACMRTEYMDGYGHREGWMAWIAEHLLRFREMTDAGLDVREIWPLKMADGDLSTMQDLIESLGLTWRPGIEDRLRRIYGHESDRGRSQGDHGHGVDCGGTAALRAYG